MYIVLIHMAKSRLFLDLDPHGKRNCVFFVCSSLHSFSCSAGTEDNMRGKRGWHLRVSRAQGFLSKIFMRKGFMRSDLLRK